MTILNRINVICYRKYYTSFPIKDTTITLKAWTEPEDSRRLRFPDFKTIGT
jgi:hypothetical protein